MAINENRDHIWNDNKQGEVDGKMNFVQRTRVRHACGLRATDQACSKLRSGVVNIKQGKDHGGNQRSNPGNQQG